MFIEILASIGAGTIIFMVFSKKEKISKIDEINTNKKKSEYKKSKEILEARKKVRTKENIIDVEISKQKEQFTPYTAEQKRKYAIKKKNNKEKGDRYEKFVASFFREQGYYVWEHGKDKGVKDDGVDLLVKKNEYIYFVQCKDWENWKIDHNTIQAIQTKVRNLLEKEEGLRKLTNGYKQKILYVSSKKCLTAGAYKYIEENSEILEYQVIPIK